MRSYEVLQSQQIIVNKRGVGFFVTDDATERIKAMKKELFLTEELPALFANMEMLGVSLPDVEAMYEEWKKRK